jgi:hypothetical protein
VVINYGQWFEDTAERDVIDRLWTSVNQNDTAGFGYVELIDEFDWRLQQCDELAILGTHDRTAAHEPSLSAETLSDQRVNCPARRYSVGIGIVVHHHDKVTVWLENLQQTNGTASGRPSIGFFHRKNLIKS